MLSYFRSIDLSYNDIIANQNSNLSSSVYILVYGQVSFIYFFVSYFLFPFSTRLMFHFQLCNLLIYHV